MSVGLDMGPGLREISAGHLRGIEAGNSSSPLIVFLHGWPQNCEAYDQVLGELSNQFHAVSLDLPGIGRSVGTEELHSARQVAELVREAARCITDDPFLLVGNDYGGMVTYTYMCEYGKDLAGAGIVSTVIPGVEPWSKIAADPRVWHFQFNAIPDLPETMVLGRQAAYFDYFYDLLSSKPESMTAERRGSYVQAYAPPSALTAGFNWYRGFKEDAQSNAGLCPNPRPLLYLRGEHESDIAPYVEGFHSAGIADLTWETLPGAGHFGPEEAPVALADAVRDFYGHLAAQSKAA